MNNEINRKGQNGTQSRGSNSMPINHRNGVNQHPQNKTNRMGPHGQTTAMDAQRQRPQSQEAILQANRQRAAMKSAAVKPKSKINNKMIIGLSIGAIAIVGVAIGVPVGMTVVADNVRANQISTIAFTKDYQDFLIEYGDTTNLDSAAKIQSFVNSKSSDWMKWVNPFKRNGNQANDSLKSIEKITVREPKTGEYNLEFGFVWNDQYGIGDELENFKVSIQPVTLNWIEQNGNTVVQSFSDLVSQNFNFEDSDAKIKSELEEKYQSEIISFIKEGSQVSRIEVYKFESITTPGPDANRFMSIGVKAIMKDFSQFGKFVNTEAVNAEVGFTWNPI